MGVCWVAWEAMLKLQQVTKQYGGKRVLDRIDLGFEEGQCTVLLGPSGCGKTTLLRLLVGLEWPDEGQVLIRGQVLREDGLRAHRLGLGLVQQEGGLFPHLSARDNLALLPRDLGWERDRINARIEVLRDLVSLPVDALDRHPGKLSGGQVQRVALMRALMTDPGLLLFDEPLGALDPMIRFDLQEDLARIFAELGKTVVLVTHDLAEAGFFADRIVLMREGRIVQQGSIRELVETPASEFVTSFVRAQRQSIGGKLEGGDS
jgi:osmoprotectant transport system ATP-binding protein